MHSILLVEDDEAISEYYSDSLQQAGFRVTATDDIESALKSFKKTPFDLVILDIVLGDDTEAGFKICTEIRAKSQIIPVIFLTSLDSDADKISGMRLDANDYITKDVSIEYLLVRIKTLLHRISILTGKNKAKESSELHRGDLYLDMETLTAQWKDKNVDLNLTQLWMVFALVNNRGSVCTTQYLMDAANITVLPSSVVVHVGNIRGLFQEVDSEFSAITTERGIGYRWVIDN